MLFLEPILGLSQNQWILIGVIAAAIVLIFVVVLLIVKTQKSKKVKKAQSVSVETSDAPSNEQALNKTEEKANDFKETKDADVIQEEAVEEKVEEPEMVQAGEEEKAKPLNKVYHISKRKADNKWQVKMSKGAKAIKLFFTQAEAIEYAKKLAVNQEARIIIHKEDGSFRKLTYKRKK